jgi:hypothetical protein
MTLPVSGNITLQQIQTEFGTSGLIASSTAAGLDPLPTSMRDFLGTRNWTLSSNKTTMAEGDSIQFTVSVGNSGVISSYPANVWLFVTGSTSDWNSVGPGYVDFDGTWNLSSGNWYQGYAVNSGGFPRYINLTANNNPDTGNETFTFYVGAVYNSSGSLVVGAADGSVQVTNAITVTVTNPTQTLGFLPAGTGDTGFDITGNPVSIRAGGVARITLNTDGTITKYGSNGGGATGPNAYLSSTGSGNGSGYSASFMVYSAGPNSDVLGEIVDGFSNYQTGWYSLSSNGFIQSNGDLIDGSGGISGILYIRETANPSNVISTPVEMAAFGPGPAP